MKYLPTYCFCLIAAASANPAAADPLERGVEFRPLVQDQRSRPEPQRATDRAEPQRAMRAPGETDRGRMSPDERRQLRRDIQDAGKDIYHRDRPAPRREQRR